MRQAILLFLLCLCQIGCAHVPEPTSVTEVSESVPCGSGVCNKISFTVDAPDFNLTGFHYNATSWVSEDGNGGCDIMISMSHPQLMYGASVLSFAAKLADGAKAEVGVQYARAEVLCTKGKISHKDTTPGI